MRIGAHFGTSGWYYDHWVGPFYPLGLPEKAFLEYYAGCFGTAEVNNSRQGESPRRGRPFVGNVGKLLDELLEEAEIDRSKLYVTNVVKIRPTKESGGSTQNRPPRAGEIRESIDVLKEELDPVKPRALALLGSTPAKTMIGKSFTLKSEHGTLFDTEFWMPALATYHPAYLLRLRGVGSED